MDAVETQASNPTRPLRRSDSGPDEFDHHRLTGAPGGSERQKSWLELVLGGVEKIISKFADEIKKAIEDARPQPIDYDELAGVLIAKLDEAQPHPINYDELASNIAERVRADLDVAQPHPINYDELASRIAEMIRADFDVAQPHPINYDELTRRIAEMVRADVSKAQPHPINYDE